MSMTVRVPLSKLRALGRDIRLMNLGHTPVSSLLESPGNKDQAFRAFVPGVNPYLTTNAFTMVDVSPFWEGLRDANHLQKKNDSCTLIHLYTVNQLYTAVSSKKCGIKLFNRKYRLPF